MILITIKPRTMFCRLKMFPFVTSVLSKNKLRSGQFVQNINAAIIYRLKLLQ